MNNRFWIQTNIKLLLLSEKKLEYTPIIAGNKWVRKQKRITATAGFSQNVV